MRPCIVQFWFDVPLWSGIFRGVQISYVCTNNGRVIILVWPELISFLFSSPDWLSKTHPEHLEFASLSSQILSTVLRQFYCEMRTKSGKYYSRNAMNSIKHAIQRHLTLPPYSRSIDIVNDQEFAQANQVIYTYLLNWEEIDHSS
jgi:hypothetical protein